MQKLVAIVAHDPNRLIGSQGDLPWQLPADLAFFKKTTSGHPVLMGRKTFDSIGRALPKRQNIVLTRDTSWSAANTTVIHKREGLREVEFSQPEPIFVIGGAEIYRQFLPDLDELLVSLVKQEYQGDTFFPPYDNLFEKKETVLEHEKFDVIRFVKKSSVKSTS